MTLTHEAAPVEMIVKCHRCAGKYWIKAGNDWWWFEHLYTCPHCGQPFKATTETSDIEEKK